MLITREDIQRVGNEKTFLHFLEEKLSLPIPEKATLAKIALPLPLPFLALDESISEHIIDCQDFRGFSQDTLGERRPLLIRFRRESKYSEILRMVAESLQQKSINPAEIFFICTNENFQPFALAHFNNSAVGTWRTEVLNILVWTQKNTHIHTSAEHELPVSFFRKESVDEFGNNSEDQIEINEFNVTKPLSAADLSTKLETIGTRLGRQNIYAGVTTGYDQALLIDERTREYLLTKDPESDQLIKRSPQISRKWICEPKYFIYILSSQIKQWRWSNARNELEAEGIFEETYPAIHAHLNRYKDKLKEKKVGGKFFWEMPNSRPYSMSERPKIIYPLYPTSMQAVYDKGIPTSSFHIIPTTDFSLLAILNSNCFQWYAKTNYSKSIGNQLSLKKGNMQNFPIAPRTGDEKEELSDLVQQILDDADNPKVRDLEREIDQLVYRLYDLTPAEIDLIEEETNP